MKIYVMDCGWAGSIVVYAESAEQARIYMKGCYNYEEDNEIDEVPLIPGVLWNDLGDC